jgi:hypothetical protein
MSAPNSLPTERIAVAASREPQALAQDASDFTDYALIRDFGRFLGVISIGDIGGATLVTRVQVASDGDGANLADVNGASATVTDVANYKIILINVECDQFAGTIYRYIRLFVEIADAGGTVVVMLLGIDPRHAPAEELNSTTVHLIVSANTGYTPVA